PLRRYVWLQLPDLEGRLLSEGAGRGEDAGVLLEPPERGRAQRQLLPDAAGHGPGEMGGRDPRSISLLHEGQPGSHVLGRGIRPRRVGPPFRPADGAPGRAPLPDPAAVPTGAAAQRGTARLAPRGPGRPRRVRVPT